MVFLALLLLIVSAGAAFGTVAGRRASRGRQAALRLNVRLGLAGFAVGGLSYAAMIGGRRGVFAPDHAFNGVIGNALVVTGLVIGFGVLASAVLARLTILQET